MEKTAHAYFPDFFARKLNGGKAQRIVIKQYEKMRLKKKLFLVFLFALLVSIFLFCRGRNYICLDYDMRNTISKILTQNK